MKNARSGIMAHQAGDPPLIGNLQRIGAAPSEALEVFDYLPDVLLWLKDAAGRYQWVDLPFVLNFGLKSRLDLLGRTDFDICSHQRALYRFNYSP